MRTNKHTPGPWDIPDPTDYAINEAMILRGGSFVTQLARLWRLGDDDNRMRLKEAFPEYWAAYRKQLRENA